MLVGALVIVFGAFAFIDGFLFFDMSIETPWLNLVWIVFAITVWIYHRLRHVPRRRARQAERERLADEYMARQRADADALTIGRATLAQAAQRRRWLAAGIVPHDLTNSLDDPKA
jgi:hypothetical protein